MTNILVWLLSVVVLSAYPDVHYTRDRRNFDGERYTSLCAGRFQRTQTWACLEVPR
jgi:hypothetical protein